MKRAICLTLAALLLLALAGCGHKDDSSAHETPTPLGYEKYKNHGAPYQKKEWTAQEVEELFLQHYRPISWSIADGAQLHMNGHTYDGEGEFLIADCVVADDRAYDRIGVVLVADSQYNSTLVAYVAEDGTYQKCELDELLPLEDSQLTYQGDGVVTFRGDSQVDGPSTCTVTFSKEGTTVHFTMHTQPDTEL